MGYYESETIGTNAVSFIYLSVFIIKDVGYTILSTAGVERAEMLRSCTCLRDQFVQFGEHVFLHQQIFTNVFSQQSNNSRTVTSWNDL